MAKLKHISGLVLVGLPWTAQADLSDGDFEFPAVTDPSTYMRFTAGESIGAWQVLSTTTDVGLIPDGYTSRLVAWPTIPNPETQYLYLGDSVGVSTIEQTVTLVGNYQYSLVFELSDFLNDYDWEGGEAVIDILDPSGDSVVGGPQSFETPKLAGFTNELLDFSTDTSGTYTLLVSSVLGHAGIVDNFSMQQGSSNNSAVPAPGAALPVVVGMLRLVRRRRK